MAAEVAAPIPRADLAPLLHRRDAPGLLRFGTQLAGLLAGATATLALASAGNPIWICAALLSGLLLTTFFASLHEAAHRTAFATPVLNDIAVWISAVLMLQAPSFFREFHWEHHRETQDRERDPEISSAPALLDDWPKNLVLYAINTSGQPLLFGKALFTLACAFLPHAVWGRLFPFIKDRAVPGVAWESRIAAVALGAFVWLGLAHVPGFAELLLIWPISHLALGFYLMPEHTGLGQDGTQQDRTRTVVSNAFVRGCMWNMPYHAEHHAQPGVPFHALPVLHQQLRAELPNLSPGYAAFHREAIRRALRR